MTLLFTILNKDTFSVSIVSVHHSPKATERNNVCGLL